MRRKQDGDRTINMEIKDGKVYVLSFLGVLKGECQILFATEFYQKNYSLYLINELTAPKALAMATPAPHLRRFQSL